MFALAANVFVGTRPVVSTHGILLLCACAIGLAALLLFGKPRTQGRARLVLLCSAMVTALSSIYPFSVTTFHFARPEFAAADLVMLGVGLILLAVGLFISSLVPVRNDEAVRS
jgi:DMSO/TMAO reductase YedYZ heme-binding membrane subunit